MRDPRHPRRPNGFTLIEALGAILLLIAIATLMFSAPRPSPQRASGDAALLMRAMLSAALADAEVDGGDVIVKAESTPADEPAGRFLALAGPVGVTPADDPAADWIELTGGVVWRAGTAAADPMGRPTDGKVPGTVRCTVDACGTGTPDYVVYFVGHSRSERVSWALVLTRERDVHLLRWSDRSQTWESEPR